MPRPAKEDVDLHSILVLYVINCRIVALDFSYLQENKMQRLRLWFLRCVSLQMVNWGYSMCHSL